LILNILISYSGELIYSSRLAVKTLISDTHNMKKTISTSGFLSAVALSALAFTLASTSGLSLAQAPAPAGDAALGRAKAVAICSGCHGIPGTKTAYPEVYDVPKIGGQNAAYLTSALKAYRSGERYNQTMKALASSLTDAEMVNIAAYYASGVSTTVASK
jgi:cytochrome c553